MSKNPELAAKMDKTIEALKNQFKVDVDRRMIVLEEPLKQFGTYEVKVKLFEDVSATMKVELIQA